MSGFLAVLLSRTTGNDQIFSRFLDGDVTNDRRLCSTSAARANEATNELEYPGVTTAVAHEQYVRSCLIMWIKTYLEHSPDHGALLDGVLLTGDYPPRSSDCTHPGPRDQDRQGLSEHQVRCEMSSGSVPRAKPAAGGQASDHGNAHVTVPFGAQRCSGARPDDEFSKLWRLQSPSQAFSIGCQVTLQGLVTAPGWNRLKGRVVSWDAARMRHGVRMDLSGRRFWIRPANLRAAGVVLPVVPECGGPTGFMNDAPLF